MSRVVLKKLHRKTTPAQKTNAVSINEFQSRTQKGKNQSFGAKSTTSLETCFLIKRLF